MILIVVVQNDLHVLDTLSFIHVKLVTLLIIEKKFLNHSKEVVNFVVFKIANLVNLSKYAIDLGDLTRNFMKVFKDIFQFKILVYQLLPKLHGTLTKDCRVKIKLLMKIS